MRIIETPVLIVGAGPIGLSLAIELAWRGVPCLIIDQGDGSIDLPRGAMVAARTMEYCRRWGIADAVRRAGFPDDYHLNMVYATSLAGHLLERDDYPPQPLQKQPPESPEKRTWCPQLLFDPLLARTAAAQKNVLLRYRHRLEGFSEAADGVGARITDLEQNETYEVRAQYLVGCDGSTSSVRQAAGIALEGKPVLGYSVNIFFRAPQLLAAHDKGEAERYLFVGPEGVWGNITVVDGRGEWRLTVLGSAEKMDLSAFDAAATLRRAIGRDDVPFEIITHMPWRRSEQIAQTYRAGRVLLAGDAAHVMSPTGGFGMNTGVIDAVNLGWKLEAMLAGWGGEGLLESYTQESKQVALRNARFSTHNYNLWIMLKQMCGAILEDTPEGERTRREVGKTLKEALVDEWECLGVQLGARYEGSAVCIPDGTPAAPDPIRAVIQNARPGSRAPHAWLSDGRSTLDLFGRGFVLLRLGANPPPADGLLDAAKARGVPLTVHDIASPQIAALYGAALVLVRPDGHSCWRADAAPDNAERIIDIVRGARQRGEDAMALLERSDANAPSINIGHRLRIGMMIPSVNFTADPQIQSMLPSDVQLHTTRMKLVGSSDAEMMEMLKDVDLCANLLADADPQRILFHCTAASTISAETGPNICARIKALTGIPATDTAEAIVAAFRALGIKKIVMVTPYPRNVNEHEVEFFGHFGIEVLSEHGLGLFGGREFARVTPQDWYRLVMERRRDDADAYFISCAQARATEIIAPLEAELGKPVVTSNNAVAWRCLRESGIDDRIAGFGTLMGM